MSRRTMDRGSRVADLSWDRISLVVAADDVKAAIEAAFAEDRHALFVKAGPFVLWALDPYEGARVEWALFGSEVGCRLGDD